MQFNFKMKSLDIDYAIGAKPTLTSSISNTLNNDDLAIEFSNKVKEMLFRKVSSHNSTNDVEVSLDQVTKIFKNSFTSYLKPSFALADVNIFLNMATVGNVDMGDYFEPSMEEIKEAERIDQVLQPLHKSLFIESNPAPVKYAAKLLGLCDDEIRLPLVKIKKETQEEVKKALSSAKLIS